MDGRIEEDEEEGLLTAQHGGARSPPDPPSVAKVRWKGAASYFLLGAGLLAPWNAFLTATDYFTVVYGPHMDRIFTVCYLPLCLLLLLLMLHYGPDVAHPHTRITVGFTGFILLTALVPVVDALLVQGTSHAPDSALTLVLSAVLVTGVLDGMCQGAVFVDAAQAGPFYTHAAVGGTACSGVIVCLLRILTKAVSPPDVDGLRAGTALYFASASVLSAAGLAAHLLVIPRLGVRPSKLPRAALAAVEGLSQAEGLPISRPAATGQLLGPVHTDNGNDDDDEDEPVTQALFFDYRRSEYMHADGGTRGGAAGVRSMDIERRGGSGEGGKPRQRALEEQQDREAVHLRYTRMRQVAARGWPMLLSLFITYAATLSVFPGVLAEDLHSELLGSWYPVLLIALFNVADAVGKLVPIAPRVWLRNRHMLLAASVLRVVLLLPLLLWAAASGASAVVMACLTAGLGATNGYLTALAMTLAPVFISSEGSGPQQAGPLSSSQGSQGGRLPLPFTGQAPRGDNSHRAGAAVAAPPLQGSPLDADMAEDLCVVSLAAGLTAGAFLGWVWLLVPR